MHHTAYFHKHGAFAQRYLHKHGAFSQSDVKPKIRASALALAKQTGGFAFDATHGASAQSARAHANAHSAPHLQRRLELDKQRDRQPVLLRARCARRLSFDAGSKRHAGLEN